MFSHNHSNSFRTKKRNQKMSCLEVPLDCGNKSVGSKMQALTCWQILFFVLFWVFEGSDSPSLQHAWWSPLEFCFENAQPDSDQNICAVFWMLTCDTTVASVFHCLEGCISSTPLNCHWPVGQNTTKTSKNLQSTSPFLHVDCSCLTHRASPQTTGQLLQLIAHSNCHLTWNSTCSLLSLFIALLLFCSHSRSVFHNEDQGTPNLESEPTMAAGQLRVITCHGWWCCCVHLLEDGCWSLLKLNMCSDRSRPADGVGLVMRWFGLRHPLGSLTGWSVLCFWLCLHSNEQITNSWVRGWQCHKAALFCHETLPWFQGSVWNSALFEVGIVSEGQVHLGMRLVRSHPATSGKLPWWTIQSCKSSHSWNMLLKHALETLAVSCCLLKHSWNVLLSLETLETLGALETIEMKPF